MFYLLGIFIFREKIALLGSVLDLINQSVNQIINEIINQSSIIWEKENFCQYLQNTGVVNKQVKSSYATQVVASNSQLSCVLVIFIIMAKLKVQIVQKLLLSLSLTENPKPLFTHRLHCQTMAGLQAAGNSISTLHCQSCQDRQAVEPL